MRAQLNCLLVENIMRHPTQFNWSVQGLGMMRCYLSDEVRLHIWDSSLRVPGVSAIHSHPWGFESLVVFGRYRQHRYTALGAAQDPYGAAERFWCAPLQCGEHSSVGDAAETTLLEQPLETYGAAASYSQSKDEIHLSCPVDGTVTIVERTFSGDRDRAMVYWRGKGGWVDARPRPATDREVEEITRRALETWC